MGLPGLLSLAPEAKTDKVKICSSKVKVFSNSTTMVFKAGGKLESGDFVYFENDKVYPYLANRRSHPLLMGVSLGQYQKEKKLK